MKKTQVLLIDDLDQTEAVDTVEFAYKGVCYEIDLSEKHIAEMDEALAKWMSAARRVTGRAARQQRRSSSRSTSAHDTSAIREWARGKGITVSDRGRISTEIIERYYQENPATC
ncbi:Lsr2 family protein [Schaalia sp. Marseille-Q2122]|uniref:histone-like nucleoid-structuring protein Lsr2 n=1 Tax=Schaalia sp. Marseille-Q2122 TaxID=2736604 RepID=UPI00158BC8F3|nr:Lsr2 family protein [Schaalia sp. Marseille-Q2122]